MCESILEKANKRLTNFEHDLVNAKDIPDLRTVYSRVNHLKERVVLSTDYLKNDTQDFLEQCRLLENRIFYAIELHKPFL